MSILYIHPDNPQKRLIVQASVVLKEQGVIVVPTDSGYALVTAIDNKKGQNKIVSIRQLEKDHYFSLLCGNLSDISHYAKVDNAQYRLLKAASPGPFTFILQSSQELPKRLFSGKRKTIGIRVPDNNIIRDLLLEYGKPLLSTTLIFPDEEISLMYTDDIYDRIGSRVDLVIDGGGCSYEPTTVLDLSETMPPKLIRLGQGDPEPYL